MTTSTKFEFDAAATISDVTMVAGGVQFTAQGRNWIYYPARGALDINTAGEPVHSSRDGSFCLSVGETFGAVTSNANLLGGAVYPQR